MTQPVTVSLRRESTDDGLNRDVLAVARDVVLTCANAVGVDPPLGRKPFVVQQAPDGTPRACLNGLPDEYLINVTCLHSRLYAMLAFQLGHELGHFFVDPYRSNWFIESMCTAVSFVTLDALAVKWATDAPFSNWQSYASSFSDYRRETVRDALAKVGVAGVESISTWIQTSLTRAIAISGFDRSKEMLCAHIVAMLVHARSNSLSAITRLGAASEADGKTDFAAWRRSVSGTEVELVEALEAVFAL